MRTRLLLFLFTIPAFHFTANAQEVSPCIFYWGALEARFSYVENTGTYVATLNLTREAINEAIKREPRLWNGATLQDTLSFELDGLSVRSNYNQPEVYQAVLPNLKAALFNLEAGDQVLIDQITLPDGKKASITWLIEGSKNLPPVSNRIRNTVQSDIASVQWGQQFFAHGETRFLTTAEFWDMLLFEPMVTYQNPRPNQPKLWDLMISNEDGYVLRAQANANEAKDLNEVRARIDREQKYIKPGAAVWFGVWDVETEEADTNALDTIATFDPVTLTEQVTILRRNDIRYLNLGAAELVSCHIVEDHDPRRFLKYEDKHRYNFHWGAMTNQLNWNSLYGQAYVSGDGLQQIHADKAMTNWSGQLNKKDILHMLRQRPKLYLDILPLSDFNFTIEYKGNIQAIHNEAVPDAFVKKIERELQAGEVIRITQIQARASPLRYILSYSTEAQNLIETTLNRKIENVETLAGAGVPFTRIALPVKDFKVLQQALKNTPGLWFQVDDIDLTQITLELEVRDEDHKPALVPVDPKGN